jgi:hypothetical protein
MAMVRASVMVLSFVAAEWIGWPVIEGSRAGIDYL